MGVMLRGWMNKLKEIRNTHWQLQNSHGAVNDNKGNIVNNI